MVLWGIWHIVILLMNKDNKQPTCEIRHKKLLGYYFFFWKPVKKGDIISHIYSTRRKTARAIFPLYFILLKQMNFEHTYKRISSS